MITWAAIAGSLAIVFFVARQAFATSGISSALAEARATGEIDGLVTVIATTDEKEQANQWDQAIATLWREYKREEAAHLVVEAARRSDADIVQYWIRQVLEVEPEIAQAAFSEEFMNEYFQPEVAARCGRSGCCG